MAKTRPSVQLVIVTVCLAKTFPCFNTTFVTFGHRGMVISNLTCLDNLMPRFYFHLASKDSHIADDCGKELATLNDNYEHARKLIHKILFHIGHENAEAWKVVILNDEHDAQMIIPFSVSHALKAQRRVRG